MKVYADFCSWFQKFCLAKQFNKTEHIGGTGDKFIDNITDGLLECKIVEVNDDIKKLLSLTTPPNKNDEVHFPHKTMFFNVKFEKEEMAQLGIDIGYENIIGIMIKEGQMFSSTTNKVVGKDLRITILSLETGKEHGIQFDTFNKNVNITDEELKDRNVTILSPDDTNPKAREFIHTFVLNCLNFINDPEVEWKIIDADAHQNAKRLKKKKFPIPRRYIVELKGKIVRYINDLHESGGWEVGHRFWVRGHWRVLRSERFKDARNKRIWISPHIRGKNILIDKKYKMESD